MLCCVILSATPSSREDKESPWDVLVQEQKQIKTSTVCVPLRDDSLWNVTPVSVHNIDNKCLSLHTKQSAWGSTGQAAVRKWIQHMLHGIYHTMNQPIGSSRAVLSTQARGQFQRWKKGPPPIDKACMLCCCAFPVDTWTK